MSDIKLFRYSTSTTFELAGTATLVERQIQTLIENRMEVFLGVHFLASEYSTGKTHRGRIDSLGIDENGCPVIIEYKRHTNENVINQGLFYLDWLLDHQAEFRWLVMEKLGKAVAENIEWTGTRLLCIASDFTRYDQHAVAQISRNIELIRYKLFAPDLLLLELVNAVGVVDATVTATAGSEMSEEKAAPNRADKTHTDQLAAASPELRAFFDQLTSFIHSLGDDIQEKHLKLYAAFRRLRNFACATLFPKNDPHIRVWLKIAPDSAILEDGFSRDVTNVGHWGTGDLELIIRDQAGLDKAKPLLERAYQEN